MEQLYNRPIDPDYKPERVITVRLSARIHELLKQEAHKRSTAIEPASINRLCIDKLRQPLLPQEVIDKAWEAFLEASDNPTLEPGIPKDVQAPINYLFHLLGK
jgi:hypothetical protein